MNNQDKLHKIRLRIVQAISNEQERFKVIDLLSELDTAYLDFLEESAEILKQTYAEQLAQEFGLEISDVIDEQSSAENLVPYLKLVKNEDKNGKQ